MSERRGNGGGRSGGGRSPRGPRPGERPVSPAAAKHSPRSAVRRPRAVQDPDDRAADDGAAAVSSVREVRLHGVNACRAFFAHRREKIIRAYFTEPVARRHFVALMKWLAQERRAYHLVTDDEMERITGSSHHEGVCLLVRAEPPRPAALWLDANRRAQRSCVLALENVGNPHNLGAILRVAAHFGIEAIIVPDAKALAGGAAVRTAEGGAEFVEVLDAPDFVGTVRAFRAAGWSMVTTSSHQGDDVYRTVLPARALLLFGEESTGLSGPLLAGGDVCVRIPGTGHVESLNVSVAAGILVGEWWRQHGSPLAPS